MLTPSDVEATTFRTAMRGYNMAEVDTFLDQVAADLGSLLSENSTLRERVGDVPPAGMPQERSPVATPRETPSGELARGETPPAETEPGRPVPGEQAPAGPRPGQQTGESGEQAALRTLLLAQRTADQAVLEARAEAEQIVAAAREQAEQQERETRERTELLDRRAQEQGDRLDREAAERREELLGGLETQRSRLEAEVERLRAFEREYRARLKAYLEAQLREVEGDGQGSPEPPAPVADPIESRPAG